MAAAAGAALLGALPSARGDPLSVVNALRTDGCGPTAVAPVARSSLLDAAARELARNRNHEAALERVGYPAATSSYFHVRGVRDDAGIRKMLVQNSCSGIGDPNYNELGAYQEGDQTWIVLAARSEVPFADVRDPAAVAGRVLELVNAARAQARECGRDSFGAAAPLTASTTLAAAAAMHAQDMVEHRKLDHTGSDGSVSGDRITRAGYVWRAAGENIAAGQRDAETVVAGWLSSPGHCATLMAPYFTETGIAFALAPNENPPIYWVQVFAAPR